MSSRRRRFRHARHAHNEAAWGAWMGPGEGLPALTRVTSSLQCRGMSNAARAGGRDPAVRLSGVRGPGVGRRALVTLELVTGAAGLAGGVLLAAAPDGSLLRADPGVLLAGLVGGGFLLAGWWQWRGNRYARELSMAAGAGLVCFEAAELGWIGFQPLEAVFAAVGLSIIGLAWRLPRTQP